jgi:hypothetical protein
MPHTLNHIACLRVLMEVGVGSNCLETQLAHTIDKVGLSAQLLKHQDSS